jgi:hypothetical protein
MLINKGSLLVLAVAGFLTATLGAAVLTGVDPTIINIGSGPDLSYLVIDESTLDSTPLEFVYHYTYDSNHPLTGYDFLNQISSNSTLGVSTVFYGGGLGNILDSITYGSKVIAGTNAPDYSTGTYWSYSLAGGYDGGIAPLLNNQWNYANNGMDSRTITPGSWDGWTLASYSSYGSLTVDAPPSVVIAAVPEPEAAPLLLLSIITLILLFRCNIVARSSRQ